MQWGFNGEPTWRAPKAIGLWGSSPSRFALRSGPHDLPAQNVHGAETGLLLSSIVVAATHVLTFRAAARELARRTDKRSSPS
jgi:hypothetical protein